MKNIIVGIDFSENSINSLKHAVAISLRTNAVLHLVWVKTPGASRGLGGETIEDFTKKANEKLEALAKECRMESPKSNVQIVILEGKPSNELPRYASNLPESIIVIGTHGISGFEERFIGSNALKTVVASKAPVFVIRVGVQINRDLTQILVPIDTSFETLQKINPAIEIAKAFSAKIQLLGLVPTNMPDDMNVVTVQMNHAAKLCLDANVWYDEEIIEFKGLVSKAIVDYAKTKDVNLLVLMKEEEAAFENIWIGSTIQQLLTVAPMPLLIIPNTNYFSITK
ncbi:universal stress protein [Bacteroidales bacterium OttesenSCG-928-B11]|nr:universal stress protein [Bacteroidales bacterium OttesenSCG-928-E04]MDL2312009.1 universal stress protein [Bacteroidales bacterium OttesenSCG-928-B11]